MLWKSISHSSRGKTLPFLVSSTLCVVAIVATSPGAKAATEQSPSAATHPQLTTYAAGSAGHREAKGYTYIAGLRSTQKKGVQAVDTTIAVPSDACTSPDLQGNLLGLGDEDVIGAPAFLGGVYVACTGVGEPYLMLDAQVCGSQQGDEAVQIGDNVTVSARVSGPQVTVTTIDTTTGTTVTATALVSDCTKTGSGPSVKTATIGSFPLFDGDGNIVPVPQMAVDTPCDCFTFGSDLPQPYKAVVRHDAWTKSVTHVGDLQFSVTFVHVRLSMCHYTQETGEMPSGPWSYSSPTAPNESTGADDITLPNDCFLLSLSAPGHFDPAQGTPVSETVRLYANNTQDPYPHPGNTIFTTTVAGSITGSGTLSVPLWSAVALSGQTTYWISVQANYDQSAGPGATWYWTAVSATSGDLGMWETTNDYEYNCYHSPALWQSVVACFPGANYKDYAFKLN